MKFDGHYREIIELADGRTALLRLLRPEDKPHLSGGFARLSEQGRYRRFLTHKNKLSEAELDYLTDVDQESHFAMGAVTLVDGEETDGLGVARFVCLTEDPSTADSAITVVDDAQGIGLGTILFRRLIEAAVERGVRVFRGEILANNQAMLSITKGISESAIRGVASGVALIEIDLPGAVPANDEKEWSPDGRGLLRLAGEKLATLRNFVGWKIGIADAEPAIQENTREQEE